MMPWLICKDGETGEIFVADVRTHMIFLRGNADSREAITELVYHGNLRFHQVDEAAHNTTPQASQKD